ncbi:MAG: hypothetical protein PVH89_04985, partial [Gammaproteobacteria bacterium]
VRHTIRLCLEKDPAKRIADIRDVRLALEGRFETEMAGAEGSGSIQQSLTRRILGPSAALTLGLAIAGTLAFAVWPDPEPKSITTFEILLTEDQNPRNTGRPVLDISRDGRVFVFNTDSGVFMRRLDGLETVVIPGTEFNLAGPVLSPDGQEMAFYNFDGLVQRTATAGGAVVTVAAALQDNLYGAYWSDDDEIFYGQPEGIYRVSAFGGDAELVIPLAEGEVAYGTQLLPDGDSLLFSVGPSTNWDDASIVVQSITTGERTELISGGNDARYAPTGHILYAFDDVLYAVAFDLEALRIMGGGEPMVEDLVRADLTGAANFSISDDGTLIYLTGATGFANNLVWVYRDGSEEGFTQVEPGAHFNPRISPDGSKLAITINTGNEGGQDIWIYDLLRPSAPNRITFDPGFDMRAVWMPDSERVVYYAARERGQLLMRNADGTGPETLVAEAGGVIMLPEVVVPDDGGIILRNDVSSDRDLFLLNADGVIEPLISEENYHENFSSLSPDGNWIAYTSNKTGRYEIYARPYPNVDGRERRVSTNGGVEPLWSPTGDELFYLNDGDAWAVSIETEPEFVARDPVRMFPTPYAMSDASRPNWDIHPDGERFLFIGRSTQNANQERAAIVVVENWFEELERRVPVD